MGGARGRVAAVVMAVMLCACRPATGGGPTGETVRSAPAATAAARNAAASPDATTAGPDVQVLVFSATEGYRHASIPDGIAAIRDIGGQRGWQVDATEDAGRFTDDGLAGYDVVVWLSTTGDVLDEGQQAAFERWVQGGGGYVGVHAASDTEYGWDWYGRLVGAWFDQHPEIQEAGVIVEDADHPSTAHLDDPWVRTDEWYDFRTNPRDEVRVLLRVDESTYDGGTMGADHPIAWCHEHDGGRAWYTAGGHTAESFADPAFRAHLGGGIASVAGAADGC